MCMENTKRFEHTEPIHGYKVLFKLKNGDLVSYYTFLREKYDNYVWKHGENVTDNIVGLHMYAKDSLYFAKKYVELFDIWIKMYMGRKKGKEVKSILILNATINPSKKTKSGYHNREDCLGYASDNLTIDTHKPVVELKVHRVFKRGVNKNKQFSKLCKELGIFD